MKILSTILAGVLAAGALLAALPGEARADAGPSPVATLSDLRPPLSTLTGTDAEVREYGRREADSPAVQDFQGGYVDTLTVVLIVVVVLLVLILI